MTWKKRTQKQAPEAEEKSLGTVIKVPGFQIGVSVIAIALAALAALAFAVVDEGARQALSFLVAAGALSGGAITAHHVWLGLQTSIEQRTQALEEQKVGRALGFLSRWNDPNMARLRRQWRKILPSLEAANKAGESIVPLIHDDLAKRTVVADVLNFYEEMGYAAQSGAADLETLERFFKGVAVRYYSATRTWIDYRRNESKLAWSEFEWLCNQWKN